MWADKTEILVQGTHIFEPVISAKYSNQPLLCANQTLTIVDDFFLKKNLIVDY